MRKRLTAFAALLGITASLAVMPPATVHAEFRKIAEKDYESMTQHFKHLDISGVANRGFADDVAADGVGGWSDQGPENDLSSFDLRGVNKLCGVEFNIIEPNDNKGKSCLVLRGQNDQNVPTSAEIPVDDKVAGVYFLHASAWLSDVVGRYVFVYEDGSEEPVTLRGNKDVFNWWGSGNGDYTLTAWSGENKSTSMVSLYMFCCANPQPSKKVKLIRAETDGDKAYLMLVAATVTDAGPYMMEPDDTNPDMSNWYAYEPSKMGEVVDTPLDFSYLLDAPAGKHGYIRAQGDDLYFEDGTKAYFWGAVMTGEDFIGLSKEQLEQLARRVAAYGLNVIRFHHMDSNFTAPKYIFKSGNRDLEFRPSSMDTFCFFLNELKKNGVYWMIDQTVGRSPNEDNNDIPGWQGALGSKGPAWFDAREQELRMQYSEKLLTWNNPYTGMTIGEDPSLILVDYENENDLTGAFSIAEKFSYFNDELKDLFIDWLKERYKTDEALKAAWDDDSGKIGLQAWEGISKGELEIVSSRSKYTDARQQDIVRFCIDLAIDYSNRYTEFIRSLGVKALITPNTNWGNLPINAYIHAACADYSDIHSYWTLTTLGGFNEGNLLNYNGPVSCMSVKTAQFIGDLANCRIYGMPWTISEWNSCAVNPTQVEGCLLVSAFASMQNWTPFIFEYGGGTFSYMDRPASRVLKINHGLVLQDNNILINEFMLENNPAKMAVMPSCAAIRLRCDVKEPDKGYYVRTSAQDAAEVKSISRDVGIGAIGKTGLMYDVRDYDPNKIDNDVLYLEKKAKKDKTPYVSVTGEMSTDLNNQIFKINTEMSQAAVGYMFGTVQEFDDFKFEIDNKFAHVGITSLSKDEPIYSCDSLLLSVAGDQRNSGEVRSSDQRKVISTGHSPILIEQITGKVTLKSKDDFEVYTLSSGGKRIKRANTAKDKDGNTVIYLSVNDHAMNYEIVRTKKNGESKPNEKIVFSENKIESVFTDVGFDHWANKEITRLALLEYIDLNWDGEFKPEENITKGTALKWIINTSGLNKKSAKENFADIDENDPDARFYGIAKTLGLIGGDENGNLNKDNAITRAEVMAAMEKAIKLTKQRQSGITGTEKTSYSDWDDVAADKQGAAEFMLAQGYVKDLWQGVLEPEKAVTRAELAHILFGMLWY